MQILNMKVNRTYEMPQGIIMSEAILALSTIVVRNATNTTSIVATVHQNLSLINKPAVDTFTIDVPAQQIIDFETATGFPFWETVNGNIQLSAAALQAVLNFDNPQIYGEKIGDKWEIPQA